MFFVFIFDELDLKKIYTYTYYLVKNQYFREIN